jgi:K+-transporting ATPase, A chain
LSEVDRGRDKASWRDALLKVLAAWNRHQVWKVLTAIVAIWIVSGTALYFAERGTNPAFKTLGESLWNVWVTLFSGLNNAPNSSVGRLGGFRRACRWCRPGRFVHRQRGVDPDRTLTKES